MTVVVKRSALKMWLVAMGGIPLLVISLDVLTERRITQWLTDLMFEPEDVQIFEPRDVIFAWVMFLFGALLVIWGLKELFMPTKVVECREEGLALRLSGPFRGPSVIPWGNIDGVAGADVEDDGDVVPLLMITVADREELPDDPWGARWVASHDLGILAQDWEEEPQTVVERIDSYASELKRGEEREDSVEFREES